MKKTVRKTRQGR